MQELEERVKKFKEDIKKVCIYHQMLMVPDECYPTFYIEEYWEKGMENFMSSDIGETILTKDFYNKHRDE